MRGIAMAIPWEVTKDADGTYGKSIKTRNGGSQTGAIQGTELDVSTHLVHCCIWTTSLFQPCTFEFTSLCRACACFRGVVSFAVNTIL